MFKLGAIDFADPASGYVVTGNITDNAQRFAADRRVTLMQAPELTHLLRLGKGPKRKP